MSHIDLMKLVRDKIKGLKAYQVENQDEGTKLHANENPYPPSPELLNKYSNSWMSCNSIVTPILIAES